MIGAAARWWWVPVIGVLAFVTVRQHDQLVTWRLKDKDQQAVEAQLRRDVSDRDTIINAHADREAGDAGAFKPATG